MALLEHLCANTAQLSKHYPELTLCPWRGRICTNMRDVKLSLSVGGSSGTLGYPATNSWVCIYNAEGQQKVAYPVVSVIHLVMLRVAL